MRINKFNTLLFKEMQPHVLKDCNLVVDAQNYFYNMYRDSKLSSKFGCESHNFAKYLKNKLGKFSEARIKCYFVFKGGSKDVENRYKNKTGKNSSDRMSIVFVKTICRQVLEEMGFDYVVCKFEAKEHCAALAEKLQCPVMSNDIEVCILSNSYVNYFTLHFDPINKQFKCKLLRFSDFLKKYNLTKDMFSLFILISDEIIYPEGYFWKFLQRFEVRNNLPAKYTNILKWLSRKSKDVALHEIMKTFQPVERKRILLKQKEILSDLCNPPPCGVPFHYFVKKDVCIMDNDSQWFEKGIALRYIALPYINLYTDGVIDGDWEFCDSSMPDALLLSADIIKYALNLLTNYSKDSFKIHSDNGDIIKISTKMPDVPKPNYTISNVVFENGWSRIGQFKLLEHFLKCSIRYASWEHVLELPSDARLLMVALVYMAHQSETWGAREVYSVLTSFAVLCSNEVDVLKQDRACAILALMPYYNMDDEVEKTVIYRLWPVPTLSRTIELFERTVWFLSQSY